MGIVQLPTWRMAGGERIAFRRGLLRPGADRPALSVVRVEQPANAYCSACAAPIDFGAVWRGSEAYCSVECSLGGDRPA